jgi:hypothetical protein
VPPAAIRSTEKLEAPLLLIKAFRNSDAAISISDNDGLFPFVDPEHCAVRSHQQRLTVSNARQVRRELTVKLKAAGSDPIGNGIDSWVIRLRTLCMQLLVGCHKIPYVGNERTPLPGCSGRVDDGKEPKSDYHNNGYCDVAEEPEGGLCDNTHALVF